MRKLSFIPCLTVIFAACLLMAGCSKEQVSQKREVSLRIIFPPELIPYVAFLQQKLLAQDSPTTVDIKLEQSSEYSVNAANKISSGELKTEAWISPMSALVDYSNSKIINLGARQVSCQKIFTTPTVIAAQDTFIENFKDKSHFFSWHDFMDLTSNVGSNGQNYLISYAMGMPETTASGLPALLQLLHLAKPQKMQTLTPAGLNDDSLKAHFRKYLNTVAYYAPREDNLFAKTAAIQDHLFFALSTEQQLIRYNLTKSPDQKMLYALYPTEGSLWLDYSLCLSDADWVSPLQRSAFKELSDFIAADKHQADIIRHGFRSVKLETKASAYDSFVNAGSIAALSDSSKVVVENALLKYVLQNQSSMKKPFAAIYLLDTSGSTENGSILLAGKRMMRALLSSNNPQDTSSLMTFSEDVKLISKFSNDHSEKIKALDPLQGTGGSAFYDALAESISKISDEKLQTYRKIIYVFTDGNDNTSKMSLGTLIDLIRETRRHHDISLEIVAIQGSEDLSDIDKIAKAFNGNLYKTTLEEIDRIVADLSGAY